MRKLGLLVMPLMAISLLVSCGGGGNPNPGQKEWYEDTTYINSLTSADVTKENPDGSIGVIQTIKVNGLDHKVRLIGVDEDYEDEGKTKPIHTTWEFVDLLSDENGFSLAAYWNDTNTSSESNYNYKDSTIRACLNGTYDDPTKGSTKPINWFQYFGENEDTESTGKNRHFSTEYSNKSVLSMLPVDLVNALKAPSKYININDSGWEEKTVNDKLFLLSPVEMGNTDHQYEEPSTTVYSYYDGLDDNCRIKHQINWHEGARTSSLNGTDLDGFCTGTKHSYAGYNNSNIDNGGYSWLRSPGTGGSSFAWYVYSDGYLNFDGYYVYDSAYAVAPAFCI